MLGVELKENSNNHHAIANLCLWLKFFTFILLRKHNKTSKDCRRVYDLVAMNTINLDFISSISEDNLL